MGGDIPGTYAPFSYSVLIVAIEGPAGYVVLGIGDEDVFRIGMDHDPVWDTNVFLATVGDKVRADHLFGTDIYDSVPRCCYSACSRSIPYCNRKGNLR